MTTPDRQPGLALVTGGSGFIGGLLCRDLLAAGWRVRVLDPQAPERDQAGRLEWVQASVTDAAAVAQAVDGARWVFHLAALSHLWVPDPAAYEAVNAQGTETVLGAAAAAGAEAIVHTSTEVILRGWRDPSPEPVREDDPLPEAEALAGPYSRSKWRAERTARRLAADGVPVRIVYPTVPVGPGDRWRTPPSAMLAQILFAPPPASLASLFNLVDVDAVAQGHLLAAERGVPGGRYLLAGEHWTYDQIAAHLAPLARAPAPRRHIPYGLAAAFARLDTGLAAVTKKPPQAPIEGVRLVRHPTRIDNTHARQALGWTPGDSAAALTRAAQWLLEQAAA
ncbi:NAD-dependent epimerase/dehydratase family protein [Rhodothalassium salexigens]|uniref:NAD-dependent epimerase/dehydratase family protein n=1 Tax=Rhodothalassium salexigens TaxID=1086 RepID=UPI00191255CC|nr:NAD-dependent epimerase/dehydratase family protein [Rhodothalassium salexigens]